MESNTKIDKIADIVTNLPLEDILNTVETVAPFVEFVPVVGVYIGKSLPYITKVIRILIVVQPVAINVQNNLLGNQELAQLPAPQQAPKNDLLNKYTFIPSEDTPQLNALRMMVEIALEDGELTNEEMTMLSSKAIQSGIDIDLFKLGLSNELKKIIQ